MSQAQEVSGGTLRQTEARGIAPAAGNAKSSSQSPAAKVLLTFAEAGELLGVSERKAHDVLPTLVTPVILGKRCVRIVRAELEAAVANLPRRTEPSEPQQLLRGKVERLKRGGGLHSATT